MQKIELIIKKEEAKQPLSRILRSRGYSSGFIKSIKFKSNGFFSGTKAVLANYCPEEGEHIFFCTPQVETTSVPPQNIPLRILYEDSDTVVLDKPAGMAVHPTLNCPDHTLANAWMGELKKRGKEGIFRPVNRLDKDTSGAVLCAKNAHAAYVLANHVHKVYLAVVKGTPVPSEGVVDAPIGPAEGSIIKKCVCSDGKPSVTIYKTISSSKRYSLQKLELKTGRTHQIRVHMSSIGCPLAGDWLYGEDRAMERQALHCAEVCFVGPDGLEHRVESPIPNDMSLLLRQEKLI